MFVMPCTKAAARCWKDQNWDLERLAESRDLSSKAYVCLDRTVAASQSKSSTRPSVGTKSAARCFAWNSTSGTHGPTASAATSCATSSIPPTMRLYSRNAYDWTARRPAIASAARRIKVKSFTIDGEAVVLGPDGLSRFEELSRREGARTAILYTSILSTMTVRICAITHSSTVRPRWHGCCPITRLAYNSMNTSRRTSLSSSLVGLAQKASFPSGSTAPIDPVLVRSGSRYAIPPASPCGGRGGRFGTVEPERKRAPDQDRPVSKLMTLRR
jgi:hypothetical protein